MTRYALLLVVAVLQVLDILAVTGQDRPRDQAQAYFHVTLGSLHSGSKDFRLAIEEFEKAVSLDPDSIQLRLEFARTLIRSGEISRAVEETKRAIKMDPESAEAHYFLGQIYAGYQGGRGNLADKAVEELERVLELDSDHEEALYHLGRLYLLRQNHKAAADAFEHLIELRPGLLEAYYNQALALVELGEVGRSIQILEQSLEVRKDHAEILLLLGRLHEQTRRLDRAVDLYITASQYKSDPKLLLRIGTLLLDQRRLHEGINILKRSVVQYPQNLEIRVVLGRVLKESRKYEEAAEVFRDVLEDDPNQKEASFELARTLAGLGDRRGAIERFKSLLNEAFAPDFKEALKTHMGLLYHDDRQYGKAISLFEEVLTSRSDDPDAKRRLIYALKDAGRLEEALSRASELLGDHPNNPYALMTRAQVLSASDRLGEGVDLLEKELSRKDHPEIFYLTISQLYMDHKNYEEAEKSIKEGLDFKPESEPMQFQLAATYERQEKVSDAEAEFKRILGLNPANAGVLNYLGYMLADRGIRLDEALSYITRATKMDPYNGAYMDSLGWVYFKLERLDEAEVNLKKAAQLTEDPTIYDHLGDLYMELGQLEKALKYYRRCVQVATDEEYERVQKKLLDLEQRLLPKTR